MTNYGFRVFVGDEEVKEITHIYEDGAVCDVNGRIYMADKIITPGGTVLHRGMEQEG